MVGIIFSVFLCLFIFLSLSEKGRNERILAEEFGKRKKLEAELEEVTSKQTVASVKNTRMRDTVNVAEMKLMQLQDQVKMYEKIIFKYAI